MRRSDRLRSRKDFQRASREGERRASRHFVGLLVPQHGSHSEGRPRLGVTVSRRVGGAVARNRVKRGIRAWFRWHRERVPAGCDLVVIARRGAPELSAAERAHELDALLP